jgi:hypothetical protein
MGNTFKTTVASDNTLTPGVHVNILRPYSTTSLPLAFPLTTVQKGDDEEFDVSHISVVCI